MNSTDKKRIEAMLTNRATKTIRALTPDTHEEEAIEPSDEAVTALNKALVGFLPTEDDFDAVEEALAAIKAEGFDMYDTNRLRQQFSSTPDHWLNPVVNQRHPVSVARREAATLAREAVEEQRLAIETALEDAIIALYSGTEFATQEYLAAIEAAGAK